MLRLGYLEVPIEQIRHLRDGGDAGYGCTYSDDSCTHTDSLVQAEGRNQHRGKSTNRYQYLDSGAYSPYPLVTHFFSLRLATTFLTTFLAAAFFSAGVSFFGYGTDGPFRKDPLNLLSCRIIQNTRNRQSEQML